MLALVTTFNVDDDTSKFLSKCNIILDFTIILAVFFLRE